MVQNAVSSGSAEVVDFLYSPIHIPHTLLHTHNVLLPFCCTKAQFAPFRCLHGLLLPLLALRLGKKHSRYLRAPP